MKKLEINKIDNYKYELKDIDKRIYYYTTYENNQITAVDLYKENLDDTKLVNYDLIKDQHIFIQN